MTMRTTVVLSALTAAIAHASISTKAASKAGTALPPMRRMRQPLAQRRTAVRSSETPAETPVVAEEPARQPYKLPRGSAPMGDYFDPLGLSKGKDESELKRFREAEITHSRVAMLAFLGFLFQEALLDRPLFSTPELGGIKGPAIYHFQQVSERFPLFWVATLPFFAYFENIRARKGWADPTKGGPLFGLKEDYTPGDLGFDPFQAYPLDSNGKKAMQDKELNNGRLAMLGVAGLMAQELVDGKTMYEALNLDKLVPPHGPI
eukprot:jgi/Bigna1/52089/estExt_Genewise1Plus.C_50138